ncbi:MAG: SGNH/GDSL hydrolase family protein [Cyclobacteriaceae bacterium]
MTKYTYLALGDSYTIGESVAESERWPNQLIEMVNTATGAQFEPVEIIATTGWTTDELKSAITEAAPKEAGYDFVSLLIGVNNQYRGYPEAQFEKEFEELLKSAISFGKNKNRVFVVSIPNYGVTPFAADKDTEKIAHEILAYNAICEKLARKYDVPFFDIFAISKSAISDETLIADDQLHPSGKMYTEWAELIAPWMTANIRD